MTAALACPGQTLRIGVTGPRSRADVDRPHVREQVTALLGRGSPIPKVRTAPPCASSFSHRWPRAPIGSSPTARTR
jgi:hypothetical protein